MPILFWWVRNIALLAAGLFFLLFGVHLLVLAYRLNDPFNFVMTFFAASLMTLISLVMILGFVLRMRHVARADGASEKEEDKR